MNEDDGEGFLSRWSRRKAQRAEAQPAQEAPASLPSAAQPAPPTAPALVSGAVPGLGPTAAPVRGAAAPVDPGAPQSSPAAAAPPVAPALPTLDDVARLTRESDYSPYVARQLDPQVRNAAMKKLFSDPHFNVMDGLDTYIDDYGKPDPIPLAMLRQMNGARVLGLFDEEEKAEAQARARAQESPSALAGSALDVEPVVASVNKPTAAAKAFPDGVNPDPLAQSLPEPSSAPHEDTDLRLQPHDAAGLPGPEPGAGRQG